MKLFSSPVVQFHISIPVLFVQLCFLLPLSFAFLSTARLPVSSRSRRSTPFEGAPIHDSHEWHTAVSSWSKIAEFDDHSSSFHLIDTNNVQKIAQSVACDTRTKSSLHEYNLVSPREWLEHCEAGQTKIHDESDQRSDDDSQSHSYKKQSGGAYTVLRCDFLSNEKSWRIWGTDFHLNRLRESYRSLVHRERVGRGEHREIDEHEPNRELEEAALESSREVMNLLLEEAKTAILDGSGRNEHHSTEQREKSTIVVMLTLLWDIENNNIQSNGNDETAIRVRGHAFSTMKASQLHNNDSGMDDSTDAMITGSNPNQPIQAVIGHLPPAALEQIANDRGNDNPMIRTDTDDVLPNRYRNSPRAKLSSWCRRRRLLEDIFKRPDIGDVILTKRHCDDEEDVENETKPPPLSFSVGSNNPTATTTATPSVELLEGLTSNLFVVYPGKILRTAPSNHVLGGYVRHLIIDCAKQCGYTVEVGPIPLEDSSLWEEVFVTSSIRLIIPVSRMFLPNPTDGESNDDELFRLETLWEWPMGGGQKAGAACPSPLVASNVLYRELLQHASLLPQ